LDLNHGHLINDAYLEMKYWNANINKILQQIRIKPIVQLWKHCYRRNKPEADQSSAAQWTFSFISAGFLRRIQGRL